MSEPIGVLLVNLGTPEAPRVPEVRRYLREFLADPRVLDIPAPIRRGLLELVILPRRPKASAAAYAKIWGEQGSPLLSNSEALADAVRQTLAPPNWQVELAMRYGQPAITPALDRLIAAGCTRLVILPLYPQYASSSTGSTLEVVYQHCAGLWNTPMISVVPPFYADPGFLAAFVGQARAVIDTHGCDHVLMSFHGLPERHMHKSDPTGSHCLRSASCCDAIDARNAMCYRAQSFATARGLAKGLGLDASRYTVSFQSRLGRDPWIRPYTDHVLPTLREAGVKRLAVLCPAFVADCLETLEEIGIRAREDWQTQGGDDLWLVPSLNSSEAWVRAVVDLVRRTARP